MSRDCQIVEIVGVAGSGKSTLTRELRAEHGCHVADSLHTRIPAHWPYVAHGIPGLLPLVAASARDRPLPSWDELKYVLYVAEWHRFLRDRAGTRGTILLDQGPTFGLARLLWGRSPFTRSARFESWLRRMAERWALELDAIVVLDAPDETLLARINTRGQKHDAKGAPVGKGLELIERHRDAYARVLSLSEALRRPRLLRYDTARMPPAEIAAELAGVLELSRWATKDERKPAGDMRGDLT